MLVPALMGQADCELGNPTLAVLEFDVAGENLIVFDPQERIYDVLVPESLEAAMIRALPTDPNALVSFEARFGDEAAEPAEAALLTEKGVGMGGGEVLFNLPPGECGLIITVEAPEGATSGYAINVIRGSTCP
ncbi:MAG: hypothetical protein KJN97_19550 [Deltaproteobacteria bacterium]|nr:hypothetical protein [Deltaproteobacteria bacterium]